MTLSAILIDKNHDCLAGVITESCYRNWKAGDRVVLNGRGVGETHWGRPA